MKGLLLSRVCTLTFPSEGFPPVPPLHWSLSQHAQPFVPQESWVRHCEGGDPEHTLSFSRISGESQRCMHFPLSSISSAILANYKLGGITNILNLYPLGRQLELSMHSIGGKRSLFLQTNSLKSTNYIPCGPKLIEVMYMGILNKLLRSFARCCDHTPVKKIGK